MKSGSGVVKIVLALCLITPLFACGGGGSDGPSSTDGEGLLTVKMAADFGISGASAAINRIQNVAITAIEACPASTPSTDEPGYAAGLDCDEDGGTIQYITPSSFKVAVKKLTFYKDDDEALEVIPDSGTLAEANAYDLSSPVTLFQDDLPAGNYTSVEAELYYYEIEMPINNPSATQAIRVYLSDDDFSQEGSLGHHQGDITFIDFNGDEIGWVSEGAAWAADSLQADRGTITGAGGEDPETGHLRGLYGNEDLWNQIDFMQGESQDIFTLFMNLDLAIESTDKTITFSFDVKDSWFYEDFDDDQTFNPCENTTDACAEGSEWSPIFPEVDVIIQ